jgi:hypothetical protein
MADQELPGNCGMVVKPGMTRSFVLTALACESELRTARNINSDSLPQLALWE